MAFSNLQKKHLSLMTDNPKEFMQKCQEGKINLKDFRNEFFKDGTGIFHLLGESLANYRDMAQYSDHFKLFNYILEQNNQLSMFQHSRRMESAFDNFLSFVKTSSKLNKVITSLLLKQKYVTEKEHNAIQQFTFLLAEQGFNEEIEKIYNVFPEALTFNSVRNLFDRAIETKNNNLLDYLLSNEAVLAVVKNEIGQYSFKTSKPNHEAEYGNIVIKCMKSNNYEAMFKIIQKFPNDILFNGNLVKVNEPRHKDASWFRNGPHPLNIFLDEKNKEVFQKYYSLMPLKERAEWLGTHQENIRKAHVSSYDDVILNDLDTIFSSTEKDKSKLSIYNHLLSLSLFPLDENKYQNMERILEPLWDKIPKVGSASIYRGVNPLFSNFFSAGKMPDAEIESFTNIFTRIVERGEFQYTNNLFNAGFFNEPKLVKKLLDAGLKVDTLPTDRFLMSDIKHIDINIYEFYIHAYNEKRKGLSTLNSGLVLENAHDTLNILYQYNPNLVFQETTKKRSLLALAIEDNNVGIFELLTVDDIKKFVEIDGDNLLHSMKYTHHLDDEQKNSYNVLIDKLLQTEIFDKFKLEENQETPKYFHYLLDRGINFDLLDKVYKAANVDLNKEIQNSHFWQLINTQHAVEYLRTRLTDKIHPENLNAIISYTTGPNTHGNYLENLLNIFPDFYQYKKDGDNLLHITVKYNAYKKAIHLVEHYPELATEINNQGNLPIFYALSHIAKELENHTKNNLGYNPRNLHMNFREMFSKIMPHSISNNEKENRKIEEQLEKYPIIKESFLDVLTEYEYNKMKKTLSENNVSSSKKLKL